MTLPPRGFAAHPYDGVEPGFDAGPERVHQRLELLHHAPLSGASGWGGQWRVAGANHLGFEAFWTRYARSGQARPLDHAGLHVLGDAFREHWGALQYGAGYSGFFGARERNSGSLAAILELWPRRPWVLETRASVAFVGRPLVDLRASAGLAWKRAQLSAGWRALTGPIRPLSGPELTATWRFGDLKLDGDNL